MFEKTFAIFDMKKTTNLFVFIFDVFNQQKKEFLIFN